MFNSIIALFLINTAMRATPASCHSKYFFPAKRIVFKWKMCDFAQKLGWKMCVKFQYYIFFPINTQFDLYAKKSISKSGLKSIMKNLEFGILFCNFAKKDK